VSWSSPGLWFLGLVAAWLVAGAVLRHRSPIAYWYLIGYPATWVRITSSWRPLCVERGLSTARRSGQTMVGDMIVRGQDVRPIIPRLWIGRPMRDGLSVRVRLLPGQTPEQYSSATEALMHTWRMATVRVSSPERGYVVIVARRRDPLEGVVVRDDGIAPVLPSDAPPGRPILTLDVGVTERATSWRINLRSLPHWLIVGQTRSGKSTLIHAMVSRLAGMAVALVAIDLKGGMEMRTYGPRLSGLATTRTEANELLGRLLALMQDRMAECTKHNKRNVWDLPVPPPPVVVLIDEVAELYLISEPGEKALRDQSTATLLRLAQLGASLDIHLVVGAQRFGSDLGPGATALRAQLGGRVCMAVGDPESAVMTLGDKWPDAVATAQMITAQHRGFAVAADDEGSWMRVRCMLTTPEDAMATAQATAWLRPVLPGISFPYDMPEGGEE